MSYAQRQEISGNRTLAIIIVVVMQFALGYAIDNNEQGTVTVNLTIGPSGRVTGCSASGNASSTLKNTTCRIVSARARFSPAQDANGNPISSSYSQNITWRIAE